MLNILPKPKSLVYGYGTVGDDYVVTLKPELPEEGYRLILNEKGIEIQYSTEKGKFYAAETLDQIASQCETLPCVTVEDEPKYPYRGFMIDCARHFFTVEELKKQINVMAELKLNKFHWHLTDDQGWRLEIKKYPLLTEKGSVRSSTRGDNKEIKGFYTAAEVKEIVNFCADRFIEVIPEIDMPGHFTAAIASYPDLSCHGKPMKVSERFGIHKDIACAGKDETINFCKDVLSEVAELFPSEYVHLGGDEAPKLNWYECNDCRKRMEKHSLADEKALQGWFTNEMVAHLASLGKKAVVWNDGASVNLDKTAVMQYWKQSSSTNKELLVEAGRGRQMIFSPFFYFYFDYPHGMTPLKKTFNYKVPSEIEKNVKGLEGTLWTEYVPDVNKLELMAYPRLFALADKAWAYDDDYTDFLVRLDVFAEFITDKFPIAVTVKPNPSFLKGKKDTLLFFLNILDRDTIKVARELRIDKRIAAKRRRKG